MCEEQDALKWSSTNVFYITPVPPRLRDLCRGERGKTVKSEVADEFKKQGVSIYNITFPVISQTSDSMHKTCKSSCQQKTSG